MDKTLNRRQCMWSRGLGGSKRAILNFFQRQTSYSVRNTFQILCAHAYLRENLADDVAEHHILLCMQLYYVT